MATTREYSELVTLVRNWANRDSQALPDGIIMDGIRYAVDTAYRTLRIPPLEHTVLWTDTTALAAASGGEGNIYQSYTSLSVPPDLIEFIHIRGTDANGLTTRVFNEKSDIRSFWDICNRHYDQTAFWSRQGDQVLITPSFGNAARGFYGGGSGPEAQIEMYYYRRLPALDATFSVTPNNFADGLLTQLQDQSGRTGTALYFEEYEMITVDNYLMNTTPPRVTAVEAGAVGIDGSLWFRPADVDWPVTVDNWNNFGMTNNDRISWVPPGGVFTGTLWFDPNNETDDLQVPAGNNQVFTREVVLGGTAGITQVDRIRQGTQTQLTLGTDYILELRDDGRVNVIFSGTVSTSDIYLVSYDSRPLNPLFQTAFDDNNAAGPRTAFNFIGSLNLDEVNARPTTFTAADVSDSRTDEFSQQVFFVGEDEIPNQHPQPGTNEAFAEPSATHNVPFYFTGTSVPNWFKDENEKIVLYGALAQCFAYLQDCLLYTSPSPRDS